MAADPLPPRDTGKRSRASPFRGSDLFVAAVVVIVTSIVGGILCYHGFYSTDRRIEALVRANHRDPATVERCYDERAGSACDVEIHPGGGLPDEFNSTLRNDNLAPGSTVTVLVSDDLNGQIALANNPYADSRAPGYRTYGVFCLIADAIALGVLVTAAVLRVRRRRS